MGASAARRSNGSTNGSEPAPLARPAEAPYDSIEVTHDDRMRADACVSYWLDDGGATLRDDSLITISIRSGVALSDLFGAVRRRWDRAPGKPGPKPS